MSEVLTPARVEELVHHCRVGERSEQALIVDGIVRQFAFHPDRVAEKSPAIGESLAQLPEQFQETGGGGWTFLNACHDRDGRLWTGLHATMEALFALGIAAGRAKWLMDRSLWKLLPGGMPYVVVRNVREGELSELNDSEAKR